MREGKVLRLCVRFPEINTTYNEKKITGEFLWVWYENMKSLPQTQKTFYRGGFLFKMGLYYLDLSFWLGFYSYFQRMGLYLRVGLLFKPIRYSICHQFEMTRRRRRRKRRRKATATHAFGFAGYVKSRQHILQELPLLENRFSENKSMIRYFISSIKYRS